MIIKEVTMIQYLTIINDKLVHNMYFSKFINNYYYVKNKLTYKIQTFRKTSIISLGIFASISITASLILNRDLFLFISLLLTFVSYGLICFFNDFIKQKNLDTLDELEKELYLEFKNNNELIQDLSNLIVDKDTQAIFNDIIDNVTQESDNQEYNTFNRFYNLLFYYNRFLEKQKTENIRNEYLKKSKINIQHNFINEENSTEQTTRERVLEML